MRRKGVSNAMATGLLIAGILIGVTGYYLAAAYQPSTATRTDTTTARFTTTVRTIRLTTITQSTTQTQTTTQPTTFTQRQTTTHTTTQPTTFTQTDTTTRTHIATQTTTTTQSTTQTQTTTQPTTITQSTTQTQTTTQPTTITQSTTQTQTTTQPTTITQSTTTTITTDVSFNFNRINAVGSYGSLMSPLGLLTDYPGSHTIWLADDQGLDYSALLSLYYSTANSTALSLAKQLNSSIAPWGGFCKYWNPALEVIGCYPVDTQVMCGTNQEINVTQGYTVDATVFNSCPGFQYWLFADLLAYHVLLDTHFGNYTGAETEFNELSGMWDGHGFSDQVFQTDSNHTYQSYKLADYVIAWKALADNSATRQFALGYNTTVQNVAAAMSELQSSAGGVWTGYRISNGQMSYGSGISLTNGETTSLFIFAWNG